MSETWSEQALSELQATGYRRGLARRRVIDFLDAQDCCAGAQEIHRELVARGERVGLTSVYRRARRSCREAARAAG